MQTDFSFSELKVGSCLSCTTDSQMCNLFFSTPDTRPAGLEEADQQPLPGEQGINLDNSGPKLPEFSNRPPGDKMLKIRYLSSFI